MTEQEFYQEALKLGITLEKKQLEAFNTYCDFLLEYNKHTNLTAIKEKSSVYLKHFYDSLTIVKIIDFNNVNTMIDVGSGAGFPGVVLKIAFPNLHVFLLDSNNKKVTFLNKLISKLELNDIESKQERIEVFAKQHLNAFDLVVARAVANSRVLSELTLPLVKNGGFLILMKAKANEEIEESLETIKQMDGNIVKSAKFKLIKENSVRTLIKIAKNKATIQSKLRPYEKIIKYPLKKNKK